MQQTWIFQAVPGGYDLVGKVSSLKSKGDTWTPNTSFHQMKPEDRVIFWQSGPQAGAYALGWIKSVPRKVADEWQVQVGYGPLLEPPLLRDAFLKDPVFDNWKVLGKGRMPTLGTVFGVSEEQWNAFEKLLPKRSLQALSRAFDAPARLGEIRRRIDRAGRFSARNLKDARKRQLAEIAVRQGQPEFRNSLLEAYEGRCAVTGCDVVQALEAAHIVPYRGPKTNHVKNGLLLRADIHTLFDLSLMAVDPSSNRIQISTLLKGSQYARYAGKCIRQPKKRAQRLSPFALQYAMKRFEKEQSRS